MRRRILIVLAAAVVVGLATGAYVYSTTLRNGQARYRLAKVERGALTVSISASGTLSAVITVQVGSQISGMVKQILADFNSPVVKGQLIARIDPEIFEAKVNQARADVESAEASVLNQRATIERTRAELDNVLAAQASARANTLKAQVAVADAKLNLDRRADLLKRGLVSQSEKDTAQAAYDSAVAALESAQAQERAAQSAIRASQAQLRVAEAQLRSAEAQVRQKNAALTQANVDLEHTFIRAPVDGVVVSRNVDVGQTVAASLQAPVLFTIAQDLTRMQVDTSVDEADIGRIREGMEATFTVDAFPGESFRGQVVQIRKDPKVVQNVVTYIVVIAVGNPDQKLMPGMTANVKLVVDRKEGVLKAPNAALRFRPAGEGAPGEERQGRPSDGRRAGAPAGRRGGEGSFQEVRERLTAELSLSPEQQAKVDAILAESRQALASLRGQGLDDKAREAQRRRIRGEAREKIRQLLTHDQQKKYEALVAQEGEGGAPAGTPARIWILGPDGKPKAVPVFVGLNDGTATEVLRGDLMEGQEVIVGSTERQPPRTPTQPRLRL